MDEDGKSGNRTRLLRFGPGVFTTVPFCHDYWEEVYLVSGDLYVGSDEQGNGGDRFEPNTYAGRRASTTARSAAMRAACSSKCTTTRTARNLLSQSGGLLSRHSGEDRNPLLGVFGCLADWRLSSVRNPVVNPENAPCA